MIWLVNLVYTSFGFRLGNCSPLTIEHLDHALPNLLGASSVLMSTPYKINIIPSTQISMTKSSSLQKYHSIPCCQNDSYSPSGNLFDTYRYLNSSWLAIASRCSHKRLEKLLLKLHKGCVIVPQLFNTKKMALKGFLRLAKSFFLFSTKKTPWTIVFIFQLFQF